MISAISKLLEAWKTKKEAVLRGDDEETHMEEDIYATHEGVSVLASPGLIALSTLFHKDDMKP